MGDSFTKPIIVEFNGLPGSGKTTIAKELKRRLSSMGYNATFCYYKRRYHRFGVLVLFNPRYWGLIKTIFNYSALFESHKSLFIMLHMTSYVRKYHDFVKNKKNEILIIDQGFVQGIISLAHQDILPPSKYLDDILEKSRIASLPMVSVGCNVRENVSNNRILNRSSNGCRVEIMNESERMRTLIVQRNNFSYLRERIVDMCPNVICVDLNTELSVSDSVETILKDISRI